uniref:Auxin efflux carrier component n=2 Tax=Triticum urartu TaxID=4572 RepID=A0A8R7VCY6_TRIUA
MITWLAVYHVVEAMAPLYTAAVLGYASVRWLKAFSEEQCAGINHFVAIYAVPVLIFNMVSTNNPYAMNGRLVAADTLQKAVMLIGLVAWAAWESRSRRRRRSDGGGKASAAVAAASPLQWVVTAFSVASLPNTIIMGVPLLGGMYGAMSKDLMKQIVVMQFCVWYNVVIFIYAYMAA